MFANTTVEGRGNNLRVKHGDDSGLIVRFYFNKIYEKDYIRINVPGDSKTEWDRAVTEEDKIRFGRPWEAYQKQASQFGSSTLIDGWELISEQQAEKLKALNIHTVENLANMVDGLIQVIGPGGREMVKKAKQWLEDQRHLKAQREMLEEISRKDAKIEMQDQKLADMQKQIDALVQASTPQTPAPSYTKAPKKGTS